MHVAALGAIRVGSVGALGVVLGVAPGATRVGGARTRVVVGADVGAPGATPPASRHCL